jgi:hypothetical protein
MSLCSQCLHGLGKNNRCHHPERKVGKAYSYSTIRLHSCKRFAPKAISDKLIAQANNDALVNIRNKLRFDLVKVSGRLEC